MLTAVKDEESKLQASCLFDEAYIEKPVPIEDLISRIEEVLERFGKAA